MRVPKGYFKQKNSKKGLALSTTLVICIVLTILVALLVSMASLNITTTQATVNERQSYISAKSVISYVEGFYALHKDKIPGYGKGGANEIFGEGIVVFNDQDLAKGAKFYTIKNGDNLIIHTEENAASSREVTVEKLQNQSVGRYVEVKFSRVGGVEYLTLNAVIKDSSGKIAYSLAKEYSVGNDEDSGSEAFTGSWLNESSDGTRYVRFHVRATAAFPTEPYFYMWYRQKSPRQVYNRETDSMEDVAPGQIDQYGASSIVNLLTKSSTYTEVRLDAWDSEGPHGDCAMTYEGNGWYVTQKVFNLDRHVDFVNGIITYKGATRGGNDTENKHENDKQSFEFFGIPVPTYKQIGQDNGVDIYFEPVKDKLFDFRANKSGHKDWFTGLVRGENPAIGTSGDGVWIDSSLSGIDKLNALAQFTASYYNVFTRTETAITHYRVARDIERDNDHAPQNDPNAQTQTNSCFMYEGYGWWRGVENTGFQGGFNGYITTPEGSSYYFSNGSPTSIETSSRRTIVREQFVCYDPESQESAVFALEEEANEWFVEHGDVNAAKYVEVNVRSQVQPVDEPIKTEITYSTKYYGEETTPAPTYNESKLVVKETAANDEELKFQTLDKTNDELKVQKLADLSEGEFYIIDSQHNLEGYPSNKTKWKDLSVKMTQSDEDPYLFYYDVPEEIPTGDDPDENTRYKFEVIQKPKTEGWHGTTFVRFDKAWSDGNGINHWLDEGEKWWRPTSNTGMIRITFNAQSEEVYWEDLGGEDTDEPEESQPEESEPEESSQASSKPNSSKATPSHNFDDEQSGTTYYSVIGWMNNWGRGTEEGELLDDTASYLYTANMDMFHNTVDGEEYEFSDGSLIITDGEEKYFKIAERTGGDSGAVNWENVYGVERKSVLQADGSYKEQDVGVAATEPSRDGDGHYVEDDLLSNAVKVYSPLEEGKRPRKWWVSIHYNAATHVAWPVLTEIEDDEKFYVLGSFNNWYSVIDDEGNETFDDSYALSDAENYMLKKDDSKSNKDKIVYTLTLRDLQEKGTYNIRIASSDGNKIKTDDAGNQIVDANGDPVHYLDYNYTWGLNKDTGEMAPVVGTESSSEIVYETQNSYEKGLYQVNDSKSVSYELPGRYYVTFEFIYSKNNQKMGGLRIICKKYEGTAEKWYHVGFHNDKLTNKNDESHKSDSQFVNPWKDDWTADPKGNELVYVTFYTEKTGFNCFEAVQEDAEKGGDPHNWWADVPGDAEYVYFSNRPSSKYEYLHSNDFEFTDSINNAQFKSTEGMIFFPIKPVDDKTYADATRTRWTVGDSEKYFDYINKAIIKDDEVEEMAYYGSTQCSYYDSPIVNVLKTIASRGHYDRDYEFQSYYDNDHKNEITYQGEKFYFREINGESNLKLYTPGKYFGRIYENQMSNQWVDGHLTIGQLYDQDRAGGMFVSDKYYRNGTDISYLNYTTGNPYGGMGYTEPNDAVHYSGSTADQQYTNIAVGSGGGIDFGYTPNWYTYRIPATGSVTIKSINGVRKNDNGNSSVAWEIFKNTTAYSPVKESANHNLPIYIYQVQDDNGNVSPKCYTYNIKEGIADCKAGTNRVQIYFDNSQTKWSTVKIHAYSPIKVDSAGLDDVDTTVNPDTADGDGHGYYFFEFEQGQYAFFQFYNGTGGQTLDDAVGKGEASGILYFNGLELGQSTDRNNTLFTDYDDRTTQLLCEGTATAFTWYMHPRNKRMYRYHDISAAYESTVQDEALAYDKSSGVYYVIGSAGLKISSLKTAAETAKGEYEGQSSWSSPPKSDGYTDILRLSRDFNEAKREAKKYVAEDVSKATGTYWQGYDSTKSLVFIEGEQLANEIFAYDATWTKTLKDTYKKYLVGKSGSSIYRNERRTVEQIQSEMTKIMNDLNLSLQNKKCIIKTNAVRILINDKTLTDENTGRIYGGWGRAQGSLSNDQYRSMRLWVKEPLSDGTGYTWEKVNARISKTTQQDYYGFAFLMDEDKLGGKKITVATSQPTAGTGVNADNDYINGRKIPTTTIQKGFSYRFTTALADQATSTSVDAKAFRIDTSLENQTYSGTKIDCTDNYTKDMNEFYPMKVGNDFWLTFKYDTPVRTPSNGSYTIYAGSYKIQAEEDMFGPAYPGYYTDFYKINSSGERLSQHLEGEADAKANATTFENINSNVAMGFSGINVYTAEAKAFFTDPSVYGMVRAHNFSNWTQNRVNSKNDLDLMVTTAGIPITGTAKASAPGKTINFRVQADPDIGTALPIKQNIQLDANKIVIAANELDFRGYGSNEFRLGAKEIVFKCDTVIYRPNGTKVTIIHGTYKYKEGSGLAAANLLAETTDNEQNKKDWRRRFVQQDDSNDLLRGGKYVSY